MKLTAITPILNVSSVSESLKWFESLGWERAWTYNDGGMVADGADSNEHGPANFAGVCSGEAEIFLCLDAQGSRGGVAPRHVDDDDTGGVWMSWWLGTPEEVDAVHTMAQQQGAIIAMPPRNEPWGAREFHLVHPDGHTFRVSAPVG